MRYVFVAFNQPEGPGAGTSPHKPFCWRHSKHGVKHMTRPGHCYFMKISYIWN